MSTEYLEPRYAINGYFLTQRVSGIQRYAIEILTELDRLVGPDEVELVVPLGVCAPAFDNVQVVAYGEINTPGGWEQGAYARYLAQTGRKWLCLCNVIPLAAPKRTAGIAVVHDVCYRARPDFYTDLRGRASALWHRLQYRVIAKRAAEIVTVSEFSKSEITRYYDVEPDRITVIPNAWQQMERVRTTEGIFEEPTKWPQLRKGEYYFSMANLLKNKNFPWVLRAAQRKPDAIFAIAGSGSLEAEAKRLGLDALPNVVYLGYVSDSEAKALMKYCKAFLFPTLYEGFGIPPLEAIACGAPRILVSDTPCMREVYGDCADYIDLTRNVGDVDDVREGKGPSGLLERYSWQKSAAQLAELIRRP